MVFFNCCNIIGMYVHNIQQKGEYKMENASKEIYKLDVEVLEEGIMDVNEPSFCKFCSPIFEENRVE